MRETSSHHSEKGFSISRTKSYYSQPTTFPNHIHNHYEIYLLRSSHATFKVEGQIYELTEGDVMMFNSREFHNISFNLQEPYERTTLGFTKDYLENFSHTPYDLYAGLDFRKLGNGNLLPAGAARQSGLLRHIEQLEEYSFGNKPEKQIMLQCLMLQILITINKLVSASDFSAGSHIHNEKIVEIIQYINHNLTADLSLDALASRFYISKYHLSHLFSASTGFSVKQYISSKRVQYAQKLISGGTSTLDACVSAGFNDYSSFYKAYKKMYGTTPKSAKQ